MRAIKERCNCVHFSLPLTLASKQDLINLIFSDQLVATLWFLDECSN